MGLHSSWLLLTLSQAFPSAAEAQDYTTSGIVEEDVVFPRIGTFAPSAPTPIVFAVQNSPLVGCLSPRISYDLELMRDGCYSTTKNGFPQPDFVTATDDGICRKIYKHASCVVISPLTSTANTCKVKINSTAAWSVSAALTATACLAASPEVSGPAANDAATGA
ncbi:hypothetical protein P168DRAFT_321808 [Aspergillus campestris IBT 28561]|uniref:DUF7136 domain-containing protein n=1 Tax=Aspergillus campestris (strain IBT 28561) TaxID=1392248 RepID=A0A2I1CSY8_ASPC2|nr:uncharacterized protein P168DRAFT_321808 [Aspergillus campestris IBT 28561]PKY00746.1 hypothetical protein P168DRAFT_321808 [Aspergillus campestris IBT 28561]